MEDPSPHQQLVTIETDWNAVEAAHRGPETAQAATRRQLLERYRGAVYRYLLGALRDRGAADELFQEFALRFLRGDFRNADPGQGRFRDFVKTALFRLIVRYRRRQYGRPHSLRSDIGESSLAGPAWDRLDYDFHRCVRAQLLARAWEGLARVQEKTGQPCYEVLRFRALHGGLPSHLMAEQLAAELGRPLSAAGVRQLLHRARGKFADLLVCEVARLLENATAGRIEQFLLDLDLLAYCRPALERYRHHT
jgi:RNA polymerase sigma-70 factor (ECF subfamily)